MMAGLCLTFITNEMHISLSYFQLNKQFNVMLCIFQTSDASLISPAGDVFQNISLEIAKAISVDVFDRLNSALLVMRAADL